ncbi:hypothetical protein AABK97_003993 [Escherichia coli]
MAKVIIEIKNTVSGIKGRYLRTSIAVDGSVELDGDEGTLAGMVALLVLNKSQKIINESAHEAIEILKSDGAITGGRVTEMTVGKTRH